MKFLTIIAILSILISMYYAYVIGIRSIYNDEKEHMIQTKIRRDRMMRNRNEYD